MSSCYMCKTSCASKVIIHKSRGEVSLVEQDLIKCVSVANLKFITKFFRNKNGTHSELTAQNNGVSLRTEVLSERSSFQNGIPFRTEVL